MASVVFLAPGTNNAAKLTAANGTTATSTVVTRRVYPK